jgi:hypothetical protein
MCIGTDDIDAVMTDLKCYVDWKGCDRKLSRPILCTMLVRSDDRE